MRALRMKSACAPATRQRPQPPRLHVLPRRKQRALLQLRLRAVRRRCPIGIRRRPRKLARRWPNRMSRPPRTIRIVLASPTTRRVLLRQLPLPNPQRLRTRLPLPRLLPLPNRLFPSRLFPLRLSHVLQNLWLRPSLMSPRKLKLPSLPPIYMPRSLPSPLPSNPLLRRPILRRSSPKRISLRKPKSKPRPSPLRRNPFLKRSSPLPARLP